MALQTSGPISLLDIAGEFGGTAPHSLSEYYGAASGIPASGTISIGDFYGASNIVVGNLIGSTPVDTGTDGGTNGYYHYETDTYVVTSSGSRGLLDTKGYTTAEMPWFNTASSFESLGGNETTAYYPANGADAVMDSNLNVITSPTNWLYGSGAANYFKTRAGYDTWIRHEGSEIGLDLVGPTWYYGKNQRHAYIPL